jgi:hypothetical protein
MSDWRAKLFQHMSSGHGLTLVESEIHDIAAICAEADESEVKVQREDLARWLEKIEAAERFKMEMDQELGETIGKLIQIADQAKKSPMKFMSKIMMGSGEDIAKDLGIDLDAFTKILEKYAPGALKRLKESPQDEE